MFKGAVSQRPFCVYGALICLLIIGSGAHAAVECGLDHVDERATVKRVFDGDTVELSDGRHVRFIGINAPEVAHRERPAEPLADQARQMLEAWLAKDRSVLLRYDAERLDAHKRTLAHVFLNDRSSVEAKLLKQGLAFAIAIPPDLWNMDCYRRAEREARTERRGIWAHSYYEPMTAERVTEQTEGFHVVKGQVKRIGKSKNSIWLNLSDKFALRVDRSDLGYFTGEKPEALQGRSLEVRGWITPQRNGGSMMRLRHPAALELN